MPHPSENELLEYAEGGLPPQRRSELDAHLKACPACTGLIGSAFSDPGAVPTAGLDDPLVGTKLGEYVVDERIGQGGMGVVYKGRQPVIGKTVAIKVIRPEIAAEPELVKRLLGEARAANAIGHHGIIDIFSFGQTAQGQHYFVMEYLVGETLSDLLRRRGALSQFETITLLEGFLGALGSAHAAGVIHRDLKPSNIFLVHQPDGTRIVKLLDFGLAREVEPAEGAASTAPGIIIGTPEYMSPEQVRSSKVGPRADLYSVGVMAFQMLAGKRPFRAEKADDVIDMVLEKPAPRVSSLQPRVHPKFDELIFKLMKKRADDRPATAEDILKELASIKRVVEATESGAHSTEAAMAPTEVVSAMASLPGDDDDEDQPKKKRKWPVVVAAALGVAVALGAGAWWLASQP